MVQNVVNNAKMSAKIFRALQVVNSAVIVNQGIFEIVVGADIALKRRYALKKRIKKYIKTSCFSNGSEKSLSVRAISASVILIIEFIFNFDNFVIIRISDWGEF